MTVRPTAAVVFGAVAVLLVAAIAWSMRAFSRYQPYALFSAQSQGPVVSFGLSLSDVVLQGGHGGARSWSFHAAQITLSRDRNSASADQLTDGTIYQNAKPALRFAAGHAQADIAAFGPTAGELMLTGNVAMRTAGAAAQRLGAPFSATAPSITWNPDRGMVECPGPAQVQIGSLGTLIARNLHYDTKTKSVDIGSLHLAAAMQSIPGVAPMPVPVQQKDGAGQKSEAEKTDKEQKTDVQVDAPQGGHWDGPTHSWLFHGPVTLTQKDATMQMVGGTYDERAEFARSQSPITLKDPEETVTGQQGTVDFTHHIATLTGDIHMTVKPKPAAKSSGAKSSDDKGSDNVDTEAHQPAVMTCDQIVYNYRTKLATATGHFVVHQKNRTVTADKGLYDGNAQTVTLDGNMHYTTDDGQSFTAASAVISVKPGDETIDVSGPLKGQMPVNDEDNPVPKH